METGSSQTIKAYIDTLKSQEYYEKAFEKYSVLKVDKFEWNWSWWAMFGGVFYLLYRKLYIEALIYFILFALFATIPIVSLLLWIISGGVLPYFVYKRYKKVKKEIQENISDSNQQLEALRAVGGVNKWAIWLGVALHLLMWVIFLYIVYTIFAISSSM